MGSSVVTDELVRQVWNDLRARYSLAPGDIRVLGERLAGTEQESRAAENREFAARFTEQHDSTFDRLSR